MIKGLGSDIIAVERIRRALERHGDRFLTTVFTDREIEYCQKHSSRAERFAGRFAAKEAVVKALGIGFCSQVSFKDVEIINDLHGKPELYLSQRSTESIGRCHIMLTISHCRAYATATAIWIC